ncbi:Appr-1-p processing [Penicillium riverlandense]|uniref:Appr-1-p processing n=1 Tax=Penicillium riverlandense TaxID=1903569 RepID=UPI002547447D|nr:Appr-1-p processing [Penicillium riverlandense]KAJ5819079.1 Appr-1-p processing [Penicillium riverlandense]
MPGQISENSEDADSSESTDSIQPSPPYPPHTSCVVEVPGNLFDAPADSGLIRMLHPASCPNKSKLTSAQDACNCMGVWGAGIARMFRQRYPRAYQYYRSHCQSYSEYPERNSIINLQVGGDRRISVWKPLGTALVIPPQGSETHWIICLFTSRGFGNRVSSPNLIANSTYAALKDLERWMGIYQALHEHMGLAMPNDLYACRFNSGRFDFPWNRTRNLIEGAGVAMTVVYPLEEREDESATPS